MAFKKKATKIFVTIADLGSLLMTLIYVGYTSLLLILGMGYKWLNYAMLGVTGAYFLFFLIKLFILNRISNNKKIKKTTKTVYKYTKMLMRIINAVFVAFGLANIAISENNMVTLIGIIIIAVTFLFSVVYDLVAYLLKKKLSELRGNWAKLSPEEKKTRIEYFISGIIKSLDDMTGIDHYIEAGKSAGRLISRRIVKKAEPEEELLELLEPIEEDEEHFMHVVSDDDMIDQAEVVEEDEKTP